MYIEVGFWSAAILAVAYIELIRRSRWRFISFWWHRVLSTIFSIYVVALGIMMYVTTTAPPNYSLDRLFKHKVYSLFIVLLGLIFLFGSLIAKKGQVEEAIGTGTEDPEVRPKLPTKEADDDSRS